MIQIGTDFQGWPVCAMTLREILKQLGFKEDSESITLTKNEETNRLLDSYPYLLEDDGMGYGVRGEYVTEVINEVWEKKIQSIDYELGSNETQMDIKKVVKEEKINVFNFFREAPENRLGEEQTTGQ